MGLLSSWPIQFGALNRYDQMTTLRSPGLQCLRDTSIVNQLLSLPRSKCAQANFTLRNLDHYDVAQLNSEVSFSWR